VYNNFMADDVLDTTYLFQPRGPGTGWCFRIKTPLVLVGSKNPTTGKPYKSAIREGLDTRSLIHARKQRDVLLGRIRQEELAATAAHQGSIDEALEIASELNAADDDDTTAGIESAISDRADEIERRVGTDAAVDWVHVALSKSVPLSNALEAFRKDRGRSLSQSTLNNLNTVVAELLKFAGANVTLHRVDRLLAGRFVTEYLSKRRGPKALQGPSAATIRKKVSQLTQLWLWAQERGFLKYTKDSPWDRQGPRVKDVRAGAQKRRGFTPQEVVKLFKAAAPGCALGDVIRIALVTGARLEEITGLNADEVATGCIAYTITAGKTESAARYVPLVGIARDVVQRRFEAVAGTGSLFPELRIRKSTGKRGGAVSQSFTRVRREVLGKETDGILAEHSFRHTWRTAAGRAGVDLQAIHDLGGWSRGKHSDARYDHGLAADQYLKEQMKVEQRLREEGYLD